MSQSSESSDLIEKLMERGLEGGGRIFQGLFSNPWTGIPTALLIMAQIDPSGKLTVKFLENFATFLAAIGKVVVDGAIALGQAIAETLPGVTPPPPIATVGAGSFCVKIDIAEAGRFFLSIFPIFSIVPAAEQCFQSREVRDAFFNATIEKIGGFIGFYNIQKVDK